jgi:hypothetical protein
MEVGNIWEELERQMSQNRHGDIFHEVEADDFTVLSK